MHNGSIINPLPFLDPDTSPVPDPVLALVPATTPSPEHATCKLGLQYIQNFNYISCNKKGDETGANLRVENLECNVTNTSKNTCHFFYNNLIIPRKNNYIIDYNCLSCQRRVTVSMNNVIGKIERNIIDCMNCRSIDTTSQNTLIDKINKDCDDFRLLSNSSKDLFMKKLLKPDQFEKIRNSIIGFQNDKFTSLDNIIYIPFYRPTESQKYYESCFYDKERDVVERAINLTLKCFECGYTFKVDNLRPFRNQKSILCRMCCIKHGPNKQKYECNIEGLNVFFKTNYQYKFLKFCNANNIICRNGEKDLKYTLPNVNSRGKHEQGKSTSENETTHREKETTHRTTYIDFYLPQCKAFCDIVGNNELQTRECERTVFLQNYANDIESNYYMIHPKNYVKMTRHFRDQVNKYNKDMNNKLTID